MRNTPIIAKATVKQIRNDPNILTQNLGVLTILKTDIAPRIEKNISQAIMNSIIPQVEVKFQKLKQTWILTTARSHI